LFLTGTAILDPSANGREWRRCGNRSLGCPRLPYGVFRCSGNDRWVAITSFTDEEWHVLADVTGHADWRGDARFSTLGQQTSASGGAGGSVRHMDNEACGRGRDDGARERESPGEVCQNAKDRCDNDPQLCSQKWMTEVSESKIGTWPAYELPMKLSRTPA
jgi:crotonobetainyl-CoA:carnitine CoA-transferase CaiB-like acyl-CoA transferase